MPEEIRSLSTQSGANGNGSGVIGLSAEVADRRLKEYGPNVMPEKPLPGDVEIFIDQLKNPLVYILFAAGAVTVVLHEYSDAVIILAAVLINTILGFLQERKANNALDALRKLVHPHSKVIRDGKMQTVGIEELVPGDVVILDQGDKVPADGRLMEANRLYLTEAILTGESVPVEKNEGDEVFMGTIVTAGKALMEVTLTGEETEMGKIAISVLEADEDSPLTKQLKKFGRQLSILVLILIVIVFAVGIIAGDNPVDMFLTAVALAVSAIPEGLLVAMTAVLAIGMQRILGRKGLVRNLVSAETLGGVTTICVDKTGTLTEGRMKVVTVIGDEFKLSEQVVLANDLDDPIVIAAYEWGSERIINEEELMQKHQRIDSIPFSSAEQVFLSLNEHGGNSHTIFVNGAPEVLIERSMLPQEEKDRLLEKIHDLSNQGQRMLGFARKKADISKDKLEIKDSYGDLEWVGMLGFSDPVRTDVKEAFEKTHRAGIKLMVITGDYAGTALSVVKQLGIEADRDSVLLGEQVKSFSDDELQNAVINPNGIRIFARTKPDQKLRIVDALKKRGEVVAMMGDGVNDAPALSKSDIGIVVGEASDVAKESADLVLLDSSFSTIVAAIEEGRGIFDNIRKIVLYLMSDAYEEILLVIATLIVGNVFFGTGSLLPITAAQILWVNLISDGFPNLALTVDPKNPDAMNRPPRKPSEPLVDSWMYELMSIVSIAGGLFAFGMFIFAYKNTGSEVFARSVSFATVGINSLIYVFSIRTLREPFWKEDPLDNKWLIVAVLLGVVLQVAPFVISPLAVFLEVEPIGYYWIGVLGAAVAMFFTIEVSKHLFSERLYN